MYKNSLENATWFNFGREGLFLVLFEWFCSQWPFNTGEGQKQTGHCDQV